MRTIITLEIDHEREIPSLADLIAGRAYTISGVTDANVLAGQSVKEPERSELERAGFSASEIALGMAEVHRT